MAPAVPRARAALLLSLLVAAAGTSAQPTSPATQPTARPKIGLALSGGGARGAAHIGVLKVLDELRVPVHCVAGTSMGAVVGGAFAAGNTASDMEQLIAGTDWGEVFTDHPPRGEISVRRKGDDYKGLYAPEFGVKDGGLQLPKGVVAGVTIENFLRHLSAPAVSVVDFSKLPVPFRAMATDIETGEEIELRSGSLTQAMRASMAIPGAMSPVEIDGRLLVDGGISNNLPIDVVRKTCAADVLIAVNISTPTLKRNEISSALGIVGQLINFLGKARVDKQLAGLGQRDVLIEPELGDISAASFDRQLQAIHIGEQAAWAVATALRRHSLPEADYAMLRRQQVAASRALGQVDDIRFEGIVRTNPDVLSTLVRSRPGEPLDEDQLAADLRRIYGRGDFEAVDYRIDQGPGGRALAIQVREKSTGPDYLRFGLGLAADLRGDASFNLLVSYRRTWVNKAGGEWLAEAQIGRNNSLSTEFYQPFESRGRFFVAPYAQAGRSVSGVIVNDAHVADYRVHDWRLGIDLGMVLGTWGEVRLGPLVRHVDATVETGDPVFPEVANARTTGVRLRLFGDRLDTPWFPRSGDRVWLSWFAGRSGSADVPDYRRAEAYLSGAYSAGPHTVVGTLQAGSSLGSQLPAHEGFVLGGPLRLSGYRVNQFVGASSEFLSLRYYNRVIPLPSLLGSGAFVGASAEVGRMRDLFDGRGSTGTLWSASVYLAAETFMGPAFLGWGYAGKGNGALYLMLGVP